MELRNILDERLIRVDLNAFNKIDAIKKMARILFDNFCINDIDSFVDDILGREKLGETGIGNGIAIPHGQSFSVIKNSICICKLVKEIGWETFDGKGVDLIIMFAVKKDIECSKNHLKMLAEVAKKIAKDDFIDSLRKAKNTNELVKCFD